MKTLITTIFIAFTLQGYAQQPLAVSDLIRYERNALAAKQLHTQIKHHPANAGYWYQLAKVYTNINDAKGGLDTLAKAPAEIQADPYFQVAKGRLLLEAGRKAEAVQFFQSALEETRMKDADILASVAESHIASKSGDYAVAVELLTRAMKRDKKNANLWVLKGNAFRMLHQGSQAYEAYREALRKDPGSSEANYQLGLIFLTQSNNDLVTEYLTKSMMLDSNDPRPAYALYRYYFSTDPAKAMEYFQAYVSKTDRTRNDELALAGLLYLNNKYDEAITVAGKLLAVADVPRLNKLIAYSYLGLKDSVKGTTYMNRYFVTEQDSNLVVKDFETIASLHLFNDSPDSALLFLEKAVAKSSGTENKVRLYEQLAKVARTASNADAEGKWLEKFYTTSPKASNLDLFHWGLAEYKAKDYEKADSVFEVYVAKYPSQGFGYYWRARSNAAMDIEMDKGLAVPHYATLIDVIKADTTLSSTDKKWMVEAYGYLAAYAANVDNDYSKAVGYFKNLLIYDPKNEDAEKYIAILEKRMENNEGSK